MTVVKPRKNSMTRQVCRPLTDDAMAYVLCFTPKEDLYGPSCARGCIEGLKAMNFSGRCEFYVRDLPYPRFYLVGLGLMNADGEQPSYEWWMSLVEQVACSCEKRPEIGLETNNCEIGGLDEIHETFISRGVIEFADGLPHWIEEGQDSWFIAECRKIIAAEAQRM